MALAAPGNGSVGVLSSDCLMWAGTVLCCGRGSAITQLPWLVEEETWKGYRGGALDVSFSSALALARLRSPCGPAAWASAQASASCGSGGAASSSPSASVGFLSLSYLRPHRLAMTVP